MAHQKRDPLAVIAHSTEEILVMLSRQDKKLARVIKAVGEYKLALDPMQSPFEALARAIVYQQLHGKAAATILNRVRALYKDEKLDPRLILDTPDDVLRAQGLSRNKMLALQDLAAKALSGELPTLAQMDYMHDEEIIEVLTSIRGVGRWTVEMLLMFRLGRLDVLPSTDYGVRKGVARIHNLRELPTPLEVVGHAEKWKPFRSVASWYMWRCLELPEGVI